MYFIDLVRSATDKFAPMTEYPRVVVGVILAAIGLVGCSILWAIVPGQPLQKLIETLLIVAAIFFMPNIIKKIAKVIRERHDNKELIPVDEESGEEHPAVSPYNRFTDTAEPDFDKDGPPPHYDEPKHWRLLLYKEAALILIMAIVLVPATRFSDDAPSLRWAWVIVIPGMFLIIRTHWVWRHWRYTCSPSNGNLKLQQPQNLLLLVKGSTPDTVSLNSVDIDTDRNWMEALFFRRSQTLVIRGTSQDSEHGRGDRKFRFIVDAEHIVLIHDYREYLERASATHAGESAETLRNILAAQNETNRLLGHLVRLMDTFVGNTIYRRPLDEGQVTEKLPIIVNQAPPQRRRPPIGARAPRTTSSRRRRSPG